MLAKPTGSVLVHDNEIERFDVKTDTACCIYAGRMFITSHRFSLTKQAASRLSAMGIPLCCGIPAAIVINGKEVYRAMLWNNLSSFGNKSLTMTLLQDTLILINQFPNVPDFRSSILTTKTPLVNCLLNRWEIKLKVRQQTGAFHYTGWQTINQQLFRNKLLNNLPWLTQC